MVVGVVAAVIGVVAVAGADLFRPGNGIQGIAPGLSQKNPMFFLQTIDLINLPIN